MIAPLIFSRFPRALRLAFVCLLPASTVTAFAQAERSSERAQALASQRSAHTAAKSAAARGDFAAAAQALDSQSTAPLGSAERLFETSQRLTLLASDLSRAGNGAGAQAAASTALQYLAEAVRRTNDSDLKAALQSQAGFLYERYLGDVPSAKAAYRAAAQLAPNNRAAQEKAERFEKADVNARARQAR
jgi:hypothetical protein